MDNGQDKKNIMLVYPPFCTPGGPPYSLAALCKFLKKNPTDGVHIDAIDLNIEFHKRRYPDYHAYYRSLRKGYDRKRYDEVSDEFRRDTEKTYLKSNRNVTNGLLPELFDEMLALILKNKPDIVAMSVVYSSQMFYAYSLLKKLKELGIMTVAGGPAAGDRLGEVAAILADETSFLSYITHGKTIMDNTAGNEMKAAGTADYSWICPEDYFTPILVLPLKTASSCYYRKCAFCSHHGRKAYLELPTVSIMETIRASGQKDFFIIDDMIHKRRLLELAGMFKGRGISWVCQLKPTRDLDYETLRTLRDSGLKTIIWGIESGCQRILDLMGKGTVKEDIEKVLSDSHNAGIINSCYIMFGFPTETKDEFLETITFLKKNNENINLVSTSVFGLQKGTPVYEKPENFGITRITEEKRTVLGPKISYEVKTGLSQEDAMKLRKNFRRTIEHINKLPKGMNFFREHMLVLDRDNN